MNPPNREFPITYIGFMKCPPKNLVGISTIFNKLHRLIGEKTKGYGWVYLDMGKCSTKTAYVYHTSSMILVDTPMENIGGVMVSKYWKEVYLKKYVQGSPPTIQQSYMKLIMENHCWGTGSTYQFYQRVPCKPVTIFITPGVLSRMKIVELEDVSSDDIEESLLLNAIAFVTNRTYFPLIASALIIKYQDLALLDQMLIVMIKKLMEFSGEECTDIKTIVRQCRALLIHGALRHISLHFCSPVNVDAERYALLCDITGCYQPDVCCGIVTVSNQLMWSNYSEFNIRMMETDKTQKFDIHAELWLD